MGLIDEHKTTYLFFCLFPKPHTCSANTLTPPTCPFLFSFFCLPLPEVVHASHEPNQLSTKATSMVLMSMIIVISILISITMPQHVHYVAP